MDMTVDKKAIKTANSVGARNKRIVGNNSASYDRKHPENPVDMRPIYNAKQKLRTDGIELKKHFTRVLGMMPRRDIVPLLKESLAVL
jgi:hypothetical protein